MMLRYFLIVMLLALAVRPAFGQGDTSKCLVDWPAVAHALRDSEALIVDTRNPSEFRGVRVPHSINVPLFALRTKEALKAHPLIVLSANSEEAAKRCDELSRSGFRQVLVLKGGIQAWQANGGPLEGDLALLKPKAEIPLAASSSSGAGAECK